MSQMLSISMVSVSQYHIIISETMDLISLACQEVGLDLSCEVLGPADDLPEPFAVQLHITEEERPDRLETMVPRHLSYQPDQEQDEVKDVLRDVLKEVG